VQFSELLGWNVYVGIFIKKLSFFCGERCIIYSGYIKIEVSFIELFLAITWISRDFGDNMLSALI